MILAVRECGRVLSLRAGARLVLAGRECGLVSCPTRTAHKEPPCPAPCESTPPKREEDFVLIPSLDSPLFFVSAKQNFTLIHYATAKTSCVS